MATNDDFALNTTATTAHQGELDHGVGNSSGRCDRALGKWSAAPAAPVAHTGGKYDRNHRRGALASSFQRRRTGFRGISKSNPEVPKGLNTGYQPLVLQIGGEASNTTMISVATGLSKRPKPGSMRPSFHGW